MTRLLRFLRQNQTEVLIILSVIAFAIFIIHTLNEFTGTEQDANKIFVEENQISEQTNTSNSSDKETKEKIIKNKIYSVMDKFVKYCNQGDYESAYELLSDDCKKNLYTTANIFCNRYMKITFSEYLDYTMVLDKKDENSYSYKVTFKTDAMASGSTNTNIKIRKGYNTFIITETGNVKINIES